MNKKGQFFIISSILMLIIIYTLASARMRVRPAESSPELKNFVDNMAHEFTHLSDISLYEDPTPDKLKTNLNLLALQTIDRGNKKQFDTKLYFFASFTDLEKTTLLVGNYLGEGIDFAVLDTQNHVESGNITMFTLPRLKDKIEILIGDKKITLENKGTISLYVNLKVCDRYECHVYTS